MKKDWKISIYDATGRKSTIKALYLYLSQIMQKETV